MCWAYRFTDADVTIAVDADVKPHVGRITRAGQEAKVLVRRGGETQWLSTRYGISFPKPAGGSRLIWNARDDKIDHVECWTRLMRQRFAVPVDAFVENMPQETWHVGPTAWMVGLYNTEDGGGAVAITEAAPGDQRRPILVSESDAVRWLEAKQWDVVPLIGSMPRIAYAQADVFQGKTLSADARSSVPVRKAA